jgi:hypothetical protein
LPRELSLQGYGASQDPRCSYRPRLEETFVWAVTKREVRWTRSVLGTQALTDEAAALRCGLDAHLWDDENTAEGCRLVGGRAKA